MYNASDDTKPEVQLFRCGQGCDQFGILRRATAALLERSLFWRHVCLFPLFDLSASPLPFSSRLVR